MARTISTEYVSLDVETTGLNPQNDDVIEIAVVVFDEQSEIQRFSSLVRPKKPISTHISRLTGITQKMLDDAPRFADIRDQVIEIIGNRPIVGHNISFDIGMIRAEGLDLSNELIDTYRLATGLLHDVANYQLGTIAAYMGYDIPADERHRALGDTLATVHVFRDLLERLETYDPGTLKQIAQYARAAKWNEAPFFDRFARSRSESPLFDPANPGSVPLELAFLVPRERPEPLRPTGNDEPVDVSSLEEILRGNGEIGDVLTGFSPRPTQVAMARNVAGALNRDENLLIEAGTGTGKSLAYLLPAAVFALQRGERVVVSTATIALQDQLHHKDLPDIHDILLGSGIEGELAVAVMKGRQNYLCLKQWFSHKDDAIQDEADASLRAKILLWLGHTETGDKAELRLTSDEERYWRLYASERGRCTPARCNYVSTNQCFYHRARHNAQHAHIVITNHSLLLLNGSEGRSLPPFERLIIDEAHHLEDEATRQLSFSANRDAVDDAIRLMVRTDSGTFAGALPAAASVLLRALNKEDSRTRDQIQQRALHIEGAATKLGLLVAELFQRTDAFIGKPKGNTQYGQSLRITPDLRESQPYIEMALTWEELLPDLTLLVETGAWFMQLLDDLPLPNDPSQPLTAMRDDAYADLMVAVDELDSIRRQLDDCLQTTYQPNQDKVFWVQRSGFQQILSINSAPLDVSGLLNQQVYSGLRTVIMTSATMTIDGSFDYVSSHVGMDGSRELDLGSPFDHTRSTLVYLPTDMPEPNDRMYTAVLHNALYDAIVATSGRSLVLFTSHRALREAREALREPLEAKNTLVLGQGVDGNSRSLIERLRSDPGTVIFGTSTFWEGVDVVGDALSSLIITKFPFAVPTDPIVEARGELYDNAFMELSLPTAVLKFKQGFGRLIRTENDRGICIVLDRRATSKRYGQMFIQSLPPTNVEYGSLADLADAARNWVRPPAQIAT